MKITIIGIGASAGGLEALREFVAHLTPGGDFCYVVAQHLSPSHRSMLMELLARETTLEVKELSRNQHARPDVIYITPPNRHVELQNGLLTVRKPKVKTGPQPSVDLFFASLALECEEQAVGIVFSGTGSDGARGVRAIKAAGGITLAQDDSAKYDGMPKAAIATGCVDVVLPPADIAKRIPRLLSAGSRALVLKEADQVTSSDTYVNICAVIRTHTGIDFINYRSSTILRRLSRRMALLHLADLESYLALMNRDPSEIDRLVRELLIGVTSFFRDSAIWQALSDTVEKLVRVREGTEAIRVWIPGCSSGEEPYTIAMLFAEAMRKLNKRVKVQIFASDLDTEALATGRRGVYPSSAAEQMDPKILRRYFTPVASEFSVKQQIREMIVFSRHDLIQDPPFSRIDLISCRNLFIYFTPDLQRRVLERFHYALNPGCALLLGKSEAIAESGDLFELVDRSSKLFHATNAISSPFRPSAFTPAKKVTPESPRSVPRRRRSHDERAKEVISKIFGPPTVIVDSADKPVHIAGNIKPYLNVPTGSAQFDVFSLVGEDLRAELRALLLRSRREEVVVRSRVHIGEFQGDRWQYRIVIHPYNDDEVSEKYNLIAFMTVRALLEEAEGEVEETGENDQVRELEHELLAMREHLHTMVNELETSNEELQSLNEELQSSNEELQSANEELETSNEELQSTNEELTTVNEEIVVKSDALNEAHSFQTSILESISNAVIVTDRSLRVQRYNVAAAKVFEISENDIGELLMGLKARFRMPDLRPLVEEVIRTGKPKAKAIRAPQKDRYFELLIHPCIGEEKGTGGAVLTLTDVSRLARANLKLRRSRSELAEEMELRRAILDSTPAQIAVLDKDGVITVVNEAWREFGRKNGAKDNSFGVGTSYIAACEKSEDGVSNEVALRLREVLSGHTKLAEVRYSCHSPDEQRWFKCIMRGTTLPGGEIGALIMHINIATEVRLERSMANARQLAEEASRAKSSFLANMSHELRTPLNAIIGFANMIGTETFGDHTHPKYAEYGKDIGNAADHLLGMINHILDLSKIESGQLDLDEQPLNLAECQRAVFKLFEQGAELRHVSLKAQVPETLALLRADQSAVHQILINLIGNALKFINNKGEITCSAKVDKSSGDLTLAVSDNGIGIAEADIKRITEPFSQVRSTLTTNNSGVGLGLSLVKRLAELHDATVDIESTVGKGTKVAVTFPAARVEARKVPQNRRAAKRLRSIAGS
ncbi:PAS domain-containing protein [Pelagibius litoralis]|uniref:PAS domain-containing protein n=1 Tax=Pelagibius litoralis TaxID=374515 RepID=A0A967EZC8_9PROT|nr:chemotaxis protein CheB [Pelagibius litoralis]NIA70164.1 PAS domain-containing protein [Pelagibius litoralis]